MSSLKHVVETIDPDNLDTTERPSSGGTRMHIEAAAPKAAHISVEQGASTQLSLDDVVHVDVQIRDLKVTANTSPSILKSKTIFGRAKTKPEPELSVKPLLEYVSASLAPGTVTAILGASGSGKTTLLNTISSRVASSSRLNQSGSILFNSQPKISNIRSAYIKQTDILLPALTAEETLQYAADLRLPSPSTANDRTRVVKEVIAELGLKDAANTRVGNNGGLSGGEKRRVSIGIQMLANPSVLFLDEPTTGLDANSAFQLVRTLKYLATKGRTIVMTIHQPRSEIWELFDNLILLSKGSPLYSGPTNECLCWFEAKGFQMPPFMNPAEFLVDVAAVDNRTPELEAETTRGMLFNMNKNAPSFTRQMQVMTSRTVKTTYRDPMGMIAAGMQAILMGLCIGWIFLHLGRDQAGIRSREGFLYISPALEGYLFLVFEIYRLTVDMAVFDQEHSEGYVTALPFLLSRRLARLFTEDILVPILYSAISYWMAGLDHQPTRFLTFCGIMLVNHYIAVTCAMVCVVASRNFAGASLIANMVYTLQSFGCGFFIQSQSIPIWLRWIKYVTYTFNQYYVFGALCGNEFHDSFYDCPYSGGDGESVAQCILYNGNYILQSLGFQSHWVTVPTIVSLCFAILCYLASWFGLAMFKKETTIARARVSNNNFDKSVGKEKMAARSIETLRTLDVGLHGLALDLDQRSPWGKRLPRKSIFGPITANLEAGKLNVVMGPSGCGKTSLLNAIAHRLNSNIGTRYRLSGKLLFNGTEPSNLVVRSVSSYVCQDDNALLPSLTVRETLHFAAALRLPSFMSKAEKHSRAEEILLKMGLKDCADNLIGNELLKGISGGEKRRVTIAVQILTDPRILLLDEPTSGLDAFTASSIIEVLCGLATEGRTIILSLHQSRSDLFGQFGNILLLAKGGQPVYSGAAGSVLDYFGRSLGRQCPRNMNPADFIMDSITVDLRRESGKGEAQENVKLLAETWATHVKDTQATTSETAALEKIETTIGEKSKREFSDGLGPRQRSHGQARLSTPAELGALVRQRTPFTTSLPILLSRGFINFRRQPPVLLGRTMQVVGLAIVITCFFAPLKSNYASIQTRVGFVQQIGAFYFVGMLQNVAVYPAERDVFYHEYDDHVYSIEGFLVTYTLLELPFEIISCFLYGLLADLAIGLPRTAELYFTLVFCCFGIVNCGESLGIVFNTLLSDHTGFAITLISIIFSIANVMEGIMSIHMPALFTAFNWISPLRYAVRAVGPITLRGQTFTCEASQRLSDGSCTVSTGEEVLKLYNLDANPFVNIGGLAATIVVYRLVAYAVLRLVKTKRK
ncbi:hypothetical protein VMCG_02679 [Cytospora schulzeri]|uniref:ABC transporter domain-containing protein n=1 Tax=Cytospora schulzeri TaxID=448051 RepID=A0A423WZJ5_9PEZI|nr:hypothetical protein VMCG_02679 [Valsa malicola]